MNLALPILISVISMFLVFGGSLFFAQVASAIFLTLFIFLSVLVSLIISKVLSKTILKGSSNNFTLELPPYRNPQIFKTIYTTFFDKTLVILGRAIIVSVPAGILIWIMSNTFINGESIFVICTKFLNPIGNIMGLDGVILLGFILGMPANEIVIPIIIMAYTKGTSLVDIQNTAFLKELFISNGWSINTAICVILFTLFHWPCATTLLTIKKETNSMKWAIISFLLPTIVGFFACTFVTLIFNSLKY